MSKLRETLAGAMDARRIKKCDVQASIMSSNPPLNTHPQSHVPRGGKTFY
jgi:hypothetical protein